MLNQKQRIALLIFLLFPIYSFAFNIEFTKIAGTDTPIPGGIGHFKYFSPPNIHNGKVAFRGYGSHEQIGIYTTLFGSLAVVANNQTKIPEGTGTFKSFGVSSTLFGNNLVADESNLPTLNDKYIVFVGKGDSGQEGIYSYTYAKLRTIANKKSVDDREMTGLHNFISPFINEDRIVFQATTEKGIETIYMIEGEQLQALYNSKTKIPKGSGTFSKFWGPVSSNGNLIFRASGIQRQTGIYGVEGSELKVLVNRRTRIPNGKGRFLSFSNPSVQDNVVVFAAEGRRKQYGIYQYSEGKLTKLVDKKTKIPDTNEVFLKVFNPSYDHGNVSFIGEDKKKERGIYLLYENQLMKVIAVQDTLANKRVRYLELGTTSLAKNQLVFEAVFEDGSNEIYIATLKKDDEEIKKEKEEAKKELEKKQQ